MLPTAICLLSANAVEGGEGAGVARGAGDGRGVGAAVVPFESEGAGRGVGRGVGAAVVALSALTVATPASAIAIHKMFRTIVSKSSRCRLVENGFRT